MSLLNKTDIFDSPSQVLEIDPASIRLLSDRCLIRDLGDPEKVGSIFIPESAQGCGLAFHEWGTLRVGEVVATGVGDRYIEVGFDEGAGRVRRKLITIPCLCCNGTFFDIRSYSLMQCPACLGTGRIPITIPPQCNPGEKVLYSRRREAEFYVNGERLAIVNAEQSILAVLED